MYYINDSITSITTKWLSQLLQKVEANKLWSWGEAEKSGKFQNSVKNKIVVQIYWIHVRPPAGAPEAKQSVDEKDKKCSLKFGSQRLDWYNT